MSLVGGAGIVRRSDVIDAPAAPATHQQAAPASALSSREWDELVDEITRRIEDRVATELSRRGRRFVPRSM